MTDQQAGDETVAIQQRLDASPIVIVTRFSFLGESGWKSDASRSAELLFEEDRLRRRLELFAAITLPSLAAQTDQGFHHFILTSNQLPDWAMEALRDACLAAHGDEAQFTILAGRPGPARRALRVFMERQYGNDTVIQVVLDDDDGLASNFIADLRAELTRLDDEPPEDLYPLPYFISYANGYGLSLRGDAGEGAAVYRHRYPFINAGLTLIGTGAGKNILAIAHKQSPKRFGARLVEGAPKFLRSVHEVNDSRVTPGRNWQPLEDWRADEALRAEFPNLFADAAPWNAAPGNAS